MFGDWSLWQWRFVQRMKSLNYLRACVLAFESKIFVDLCSGNESSVFIFCALKFESEDICGQDERSLTF